MEEIEGLKGWPLFCDAHTMTDAVSRDDQTMLCDDKELTCNDNELLGFMMFKR